jgi:hypothetical protein
LPVPVVNVELVGLHSDPAEHQCITASRQLQHRRLNESRNAKKRLQGLQLFLLRRFPQTFVQRREQGFACVEVDRRCLMDG